MYTRFKYLMIGTLIFTITSALAGLAGAASISFTASNFSIGAPQTTVNGSFDFSLNSSDVLTLSSFDMTIVDMTYTNGDVLIDQRWAPTRVMM